MTEVLIDGGLCVGWENVTIHAMNRIDMGGGSITHFIFPAAL